MSELRILFENLVVTLRISQNLSSVQRAITPLLTDGVQCHLACIILLSIYILIPLVSMKSAKALPRYGSEHKSAGRTDGQRQNNIPPPLAGDKKVASRVVMS